jgi:glycerol dehydrogenase
MRSILFPEKFLLGKGMLDSFSTYSKPLGKKLLVILTKRMLETAVQKISKSFEGTETAAEFVLFNGECSRNEINRLVAAGKENSCDCVVGIGGGKLLDTAKGVAYALKTPVIIVPTIASTDAPTSALTVLYTDDGVFEEYLWLPANPNVVLVDMEIICKAPARFLVAGMGDAFATYYEARAVRNSDSNTCAVAALGKQTISAFALAELCHKTLIADGIKAKLSVEAGAITPALENVVEANILLSGIGFESGGLAAAHSIHNGLTVLPQTHIVYHGEKVAFGVLTQLVLENAPMEEITSAMDFFDAVGLPVTLKEIGLESVTDEELRKAADAASVPGETIHCQPFEITSEKVLAAIKTADAIGRAYLASK